MRPVFQTKKLMARLLFSFVAFGVAIPVAECVSQVGSSSKTVHHSGRASKNPNKPNAVPQSITFGETNLGKSLKRPPLTVIAVGSGGQPLKGAQFQIQNLRYHRQKEQAQNHTPLFRSRPQDNGMIHIKDVPQGDQWHIVVWGPGHTRQARKISRVTNPVVFQLDRARSISATIQDENGNPLKDIYLDRISSAGKKDPYDRTTDVDSTVLSLDKRYFSNDQGRCEIPSLSASGKYWLRFHGVDYGPQHVLVNKNSPSDLVIKMKKKKTLTVSIKSSDSSISIPDGTTLKLHIWYPGKITKSKCPHYDADNTHDSQFMKVKDGKATTKLPPLAFEKFGISIPWKSPGTEGLRFSRSVVSPVVKKHFYGKPVVMDLDLSKGDLEIPFTVSKIENQYRKKATVTGRVTFHDLAAASGVKVIFNKQYVDSNTKKVRTYQHASTTTNENGNYKISLGEGKYQLVFGEASQCFPSDPVELKIKKEGEKLEISRKVKTTWLHCKIIDANQQPLRNASLFYRGKRFAADANGRVKINLGSWQRPIPIQLTANNSQATLAGMSIFDPAIDDVREEVVIACLDNSDFIFRHWRTYKPHFPNKEKDFQGFYNRQLKQLSEKYIKLIHSSTSLSTGKTHQVPNSKFTLYHICPENDTRSKEGQGNWIEAGFEHQQFQHFLVLQPINLVGVRYNVPKKSKFDRLQLPPGEKYKFGFEEYEPQSPVVLVYRKTKESKPQTFYFFHGRDAKEKIEQLTQKEIPTK